MRDMNTESIDAEITAAERTVQAIQNQVPVEHPAYALLGAALANLGDSRQLTPNQHRKRETAWTTTTAWTAPPAAKATYSNG
jgi:hypothetical protein